MAPALAAVAAAMAAPATLAAAAAALAAAVPQRTVESEEEDDTDDEKSFVSAGGSKDVECGKANLSGVPGAKPHPDPVVEVSAPQREYVHASL
jgi:hypothetical protein